MTQTISISPSELLTKAEQLVGVGKDIEARPMYEALADIDGFAGAANFRLGEIFNRLGDVQKSFDCHKKSFHKEPGLFSKILPESLPHYSYVYQETPHTEVFKCPLCGGDTSLHSCHNAGLNVDYTPGFDPVKLWRYCRPCHHLFAANYPTDLEGTLKATTMESLKKFEPEAFASEGEILNRLLSLTSGKRFFEIGTGIGEMVGVAREYLLEVSGIEVRESYARLVEMTFGVPIQRVDFMNFEANQEYDIIVMGDVLEHFIDPVEALKKIVKLMAPEAVLWLSTPNFESAYALSCKVNDPMLKVVEHLNYFSYQGLIRILDELGLKVVEYRASRKYYGSMELTIQRN